MGQGTMYLWFKAQLVAWSPQACDAQVQQQMDLGTLLHHVDHHMYPTCAPFLADVALIPRAWTQYYQVSHH